MTRELKEIARNEAPLLVRELIRLAHQGRERGCARCASRCFAASGRPGPLMSPWVGASRLPATGSIRLAGW